MRDENLVDRFNYETPPQGPPRAYEALRLRAFRLAVAIDLHCPDCVEKRFALREIGECINWTNLAISRYRPTPIPEDELGQAAKANG